MSAEPRIFSRDSAITRRTMLGGIGALLVTAACSGGSDKSTARSSSTTTTRPGTPVAATAALATTPDANGLLLPEGFTSRVVATTGAPVGDTGYVFSPAPDGAATFADPKVKGGWYWAVNHEALSTQGAGVSAVRFDPDGEIVDAYRLVGDTSINCAGGPTPWNTWLTCEEIERGRIFECDPATPNSGEDRPALGRFYHEAVGVDGEDKLVYLTEDRPDGLFYRFTADRWPDLGAGVLEAAVVDASGGVTWREVPDPSAATTAIRAQGFGATPFNGGEGISVGDTPDGRRVWFSTKGDDVIRELDPATSTLREIYRGGADTTLHGVDNIWWDEPGQRLYVAEDGDDMELIMLDRSGRTAPLLQIVGHDGSEITGPTLNPTRTTLHLSSQRGVTGDGRGVSYAVTGPFRVELNEHPVPDPATHLIVDGNNVMGAKPDGWWRDRAGAARRLLARMQCFAATTDASIALVFDVPLPDVAEGEHDGVTVRYATRKGRDAADDRIRELLNSVPTGELTVEVVTSDRALAESARDAGAAVTGAGGFLRRLDAAGC